MISVIICKLLQIGMELVSCHFYYFVVSNHLSKQYELFKEGSLVDQVRIYDGTVTFQVMVSVMLILNK